MTETEARDELYAATLDAFVETRTRLAAALTAAGRKAEGQALKKVRRPSPVAWATNQVVRAARAEVETFLAASDRLRGSQAAIVAGRGDRGLYEADAHALREATAALAAAARRVLAARGRPEDRALVDGVVANARAAALADAARAALLAGALGAELEGETDAFGGLLAGSALAAPPRVPERARTPAPPRAAPSPRDQEARRREQERARDLEAARREETEARAAASSADERVTRARAALDDARRRVEEAHQAARDAERASRDAETAHRDAQRTATEAATQAGRATRRREGLET